MAMSLKEKRKRNNEITKKYVENNKEKYYARQKLIRQNKLKLGITSEVMLKMREIKKELYQLYIKNGRKINFIAKILNENPKNFKLLLSLDVLDMKIIQEKMRLILIELAKEEIQLEKGL